MYELSLLDQLRMLTDPPIDPPLAFQNGLLGRIHDQFLLAAGKSQPTHKLRLESATMSPPGLPMSPVIADQVELR